MFMLKEHVSQWLIYVFLMWFWTTVEQYGTEYEKYRISPDSFMMGNLKGALQRFSLLP